MRETRLLPIEFRNTIQYFIIEIGGVYIKKYMMINELMTSKEFVVFEYVFPQSVLEAMRYEQLKSNIHTKEEQ